MSMDFSFHSARMRKKFQSTEVAQETIDRLNMDNLSIKQVYSHQHV